MSGWWVHEVFHGLGATALVAWIFWVIFSITLHELGHGWTALWQGDTTPRLTGHMTWNPMTHMGPMSLLVFAVIGIAWGMMPVNPTRFRDGRRGEVYVALGGPAMNLLLAIVTFIGLVVWIRFAVLPHAPNVPEWADAGYEILHIGCGLNLILLLFNLLPVPPLDGSRVAAGLSWRARELLERPEAAMYGFIILLVLLMPVSGSLFAWVWQTLTAMAIETASWIP